MKKKSSTSLFGFRRTPAEIFGTDIDERSIRKVCDEQLGWFDESERSPTKELLRSILNFIEETTINIASSLMMKRNILSYGIIY